VIITAGTLHFDDYCIFLACVCEFVCFHMSLDAGCD